MIHELFRLFNWAGSEWVLGLLAALSVIVVAIAMSRWLELSKLTRASGKFWREQGEQWIAGDMTGDWRGSLDELKQKYPCLETDALTVIAKAEKSGGDPEKMMGAYLEHRKQKLERYVGLVGTVGANAAFIGLLGTVLGIIRAFHQMSVSGVGGLDSIGSGIAEALVATAVGLFVAIPAVVFFNVLNRKISTLLRRAESVAALAEAGEETWQAS